MVAIYDHDNREILCNGTGNHYIRFRDTGELEPHFTTCRSWGFDCRWWEDRNKHGEVGIERKVQKLVKRMRVNWEKRRIRRIEWWWKYYWEPETVRLWICANEHCRKLFLIPGEKVVPLILGYHNPTYFRNRWIGLINDIRNMVLFFLKPRLVPTDSYTFHYECLPEPLKELFREDAKNLT
jgi:hypothetical protein